MADNYLGRKMEEYMAQSCAAKNSKPQVTLAKLLERNRSYRGYDSSFIVRDDQLRRIIEVNTKIPSARNQQVLRFRAVNHTEAEKVLPHIGLGGALPELHLPFPGTEPNAFIIICSTVEETKFVSVDLGISAQSMLLQAAEIGLNGICIAAFNKKKIVEAFDLQYEPLMILAIGKGAEKIQMVEISPEESHAYYRKDGIHYVPKLRLEDLIIK